MSDIHDMRDEIADSLSNAMPEGLVTKWVAVVEVIDAEDGQRYLYTFDPDGQPEWDSAGLLACAFHDDQDVGE